MMGASAAKSISIREAMVLSMSALRAWMSSAPWRDRLGPRARPRFVSSSILGSGRVGCRSFPNRPLSRMGWRRREAERFRGESSSLVGRRGMTVNSGAPTEPVE